MVPSEREPVNLSCNCNCNITETIIKRRHMLFGHVARLDATTPAHQILKQVSAVKSGYQPDAVWRRAPGRPRNSWIMQIGNVSDGSGRRHRITVIMESRRNGPQLSSRHDDDDDQRGKSPRPTFGSVQWLFQRRKYTLQGLYPLTFDLFSYYQSWLRFSSLLWLLDSALDPNQFGCLKDRSCFGISAPLLVSDS